MIIHINGFPGVGKLTVAHKLAAKLSGRVIDNHSVINAATLVWPHGSPEYMDLLLRLTQLVYEDLARLPASDVQIFTNALAIEYVEDPARMQAISDLADKRGVAFFPILLECEKGEHVRRLIHQERAIKQKLRDVQVLEEIYEKYTPLHWDHHPNALRIDTSGNTAEVTSEMIAAHIAASSRPS